MVKRAAAGAGGAHLASGYISLNVKYGSAMAQIADDFGLMNRKAKETGESITRNLVAGVDAAKAKASALAAEYEAQRQKVAALRAEVAKLHAAQENSLRVEKAYQEANSAEMQRQAQAKQRHVQLQSELNNLMSGSKWDVAALTAWNTKYNEFTNLRKAQLKELADAEKAYQSSRSGPAAAQAEAAALKALDAEIEKGTQGYKKLGEALQDVTRKQELAKTSAAALAGTHASFGSRFVSAMRNVGTQAGQQFRATFGHQMDVAKVESEHHVRNIASGIFMGMTPGVIGAAGVGLALGKAFGAGFERQETIQTTKMRLEALGRSAQEIDSLIAQATASVEGTQYSLAESFTAASTAMSSGIKAGPEMTQYLNNIANAAGLTGVAYGEVAEAIGRVQRLGTVSLENIDPLLKKDLPILKWLKEYYQKDFPATTTQDITEMISKKLIPADVLNKVLTKNLNDSMKGLTRNTVKGALTDAMTQVGKVTQSILAPFMGDWPTFINNIGDKLKRFSEYIKPGMEVAAGWIKKTWNELWPKVTGVVSKAITFMSGLWTKFGPNVMAAVGWLYRKWKELWPQFTAAVSTFVAWYQERWGQLWPYISKFIVMVKDTWTKMWPQLQEKFGPFLAAFRRLWDALEPIVTPAVKAIAGLFAWLTKEFIKHLPAFAQFGTNIVNWLATAINWMRDVAWPWMKQAWENVRDWISKAIEKVKDWKDGIVGAFNDIKSKIEPIWTWLENKWKWLDSLSMPEWAKWLIEHGAGLFGANIELSSYQTPLAAALPGGNIPMPAGLRDSGHVSSGPQVRYAAGLVLSQFPGVTSINGSYLPRSEGGPSAPGTHDAGLSMDIPIGTSPEQRSMADRIVKYLQENAKQLGVAYTIWNDIGKNAVDNPSGAAGSTWKQGGHQDHIDVHFDGKPVYTSTGSNGQTYNVAPSSMSNPLGGNRNSIADYIAAKAAEAGYSPAEAQAFVAQALGESRLNPSAYGASTGDASGGAAGIFQFTPGTWSQYGNGGNPLSAKDNIDAYFRLAKDRDTGRGDMRSRLAAISVGGPAAPSNNAPWDRYMAEAGGLLGNSAPRVVDASAYGGINLASGSKPLDVTFGPPLPAGDWVGGGGDISGTAPSGEGGGGSWGDEKPGILGRIASGIGDWLSNLPGPFHGKPMDAENLLGLGSAKDAWKKVQDWGVGGAVLPLSKTGGKLTHVQDWPTANDYYKKMYPRAGGPQGTKKDPIHTQDDTVGKNTDPANQPKPPEAQGDTPHGGTGAAPGPGESKPADTSTGASGVTPGSGDSIKDLAQGLGGVASTAFSDQFAGTPFSDPTQWPATKSAGAVLSFFGNLLNGGGGKAGGGLIDSLFGGGGVGGKGATAKQLREAQQRIDDMTVDIAEQKKKIEGMIGHPQNSPEEIEKERAKLDRMNRDLTDARADQSTMQGGAAGGNPWGSFLSSWGIPQPAQSAGGATGFAPTAYGGSTIGSPGAAPGSMGIDVMQPGSSNVGPAVLNALPSQPNNPANLAPGQPNTPGQTNIDMSINQQVATPGITAAQDVARRAMNTQLNSPLLAVTRGALV